MAAVYKYKCVILSWIAGPGGEDADSDEEWPSLGAAGTAEAAECDTEVVVDPDDEKAIELFMNKNPPLR